MNKTRRDTIAKLQARISELKDEVEMVRDEEQEYYDNMPENMQQGDKGQNAESAVSALDEAMENLDSAMSSLDEASQN